MQTAFHVHICQILTLQRSISLDMACKIKHKLHTIDFLLRILSFSNLSCQHLLPLQANGYTEATSKVTKIQFKKAAKRTENSV